MHKRAVPRVRAEQTSMAVPHATARICARGGRGCAREEHSPVAVRVAGRLYGVVEQHAALGAGVVSTRGRRFKHKRSNTHIYLPS